MNAKEMDTKTGNVTSESSSHSTISSKHLIEYLYILSANIHSVQLEDSLHMKFKLFFEKWSQ